MDLSKIFDVFSRRNQIVSSKEDSISEEFRTRVLFIVSNLFSNTQHGDYRNQFWEDIHERFILILGKWRLSSGPRHPTHIEDTIAFLTNCDDSYFLDFLETIFKTDCYWRIRQGENKLVDDINELFLVDDLRYSLTKFVREEKPTTMYGSDRISSVVVSYPKVILRGNEYTFSGIIEPAMNLLADERYMSANTEFIDALEDYKNGNYGDSLTKCCSAFESVMKILCNTHSWNYSQTDTAAQLIRIIIKESKLEPFFEQPLLNIATIRNRLSKSHGSGTQTRNPTQPKAEYALNSTASAIIFLIEHATSITS